MTSKYKRITLAFAAIIPAVIAFIIWKWIDSRSTLWRIVSNSCIPAAQAAKGTGRCAEVSLQNGVEFGHVVFKDRNGPLQYLLMPTKRVAGAEDPFLLSEKAPNYWGAAWHSKHWMEVSYGAPIPRDTISITVNSFWGRSQNQLHLHVSCVRDDLRVFLKSLPEGESNNWNSIPGGWQGHSYEYRKIIAETLDGQDIFKEVARDRSNSMARQGIAVIATRFGDQNGFWLLRTQLEMKSLWLASIEGDIQDHSCNILPIR